VDEMGNPDVVLLDNKWTRSVHFKRRKQRILRFLCQTARD